VRSRWFWSGRLRCQTVRSVPGRKAAERAKPELRCVHSLSPMVSFPSSAPDPRQCAIYGACRVIYVLGVATTLGEVFERDRVHQLVPEPRVHCGRTTRCKAVMKLSASDEGAES